MTVENGISRITGCFHARNYDEVFSVAGSFEVLNFDGNSGNNDDLSCVFSDGTSIEQMSIVSRDDFAENRINVDLFEVSKEMRDKKERKEKQQLEEQPKRARPSNRPPLPYSKKSIRQKHFRNKNQGKVPSPARHQQEENPSPVVRANTEPKNLMDVIEQQQGVDRKMKSRNFILRLKHGLRLKSNNPAKNKLLAETDDDDGMEQGDAYDWSYMNPHPYEGKGHNHSDRHELTSVTLFSDDDSLLSYLTTPQA